jgi:hypothetical protein
MLGICAKGILQLLSCRLDQEVSKVRPLTQPFVSAVRGPEVAKLRSVT